MAKCLTKAASLIPKITARLISPSGKSIDFNGLYSEMATELINKSTGIEEDLRALTEQNMTSNDLGRELIKLTMHIRSTVDNANAKGISNSVEFPNNPAVIQDLTKSLANEMLRPAESVNITEGKSEEPPSTVEGEETLTSDNDVVPEDKVEDEEIPDESPIVKPVNAKKLRDVLKHYLVGNMVGQDDQLANFFSAVVARSWLSTDIAAKTGFEFDEAVVKKAILAHVNKVTRGYYQKNAQLIYTVRNVDNVSSQEHNTLIYEDVKKLPPDRKLIHEVADPENPQAYGEFYTSESLVGEDGKPLLLVVTDDYDVIPNEIANYAETFGEGAEADETSLIAAADNGMPALNRSTIQDNYLSTDVTAAYFATIVKDNLDTFVRDLVPQLEKSYKTFVRVGPMEADKAGSDMASKLLKLSIATTPLLYNTSNIDDSIAMRQKVVLDSKESSMGEALANSKIVEPVDVHGSKMFSFTRMGATHYGMVFDAGGSKATVVYDPTKAEGARWSYISATADGVKLKSREDIKNDKINDPNYNSFVASTLKMLNKSAGTDETMGELASQLFAKPLSEVDIREMVSTLNQPPTKSTDVHTLTSNNVKRTFLYEAEVEMASKVLQFLPDSFDGAKTYLTEQMNDNTSPYRDIARSIYYRYFHEGEYKVTQINPITGLIETVTHRSMYDQAMRDGNKQAREAVTSMMSKLKSTALSNKIGRINDKTVITNVEQGTTIDSFLTDIDAGSTMLVSGRRVTTPEIYKKFKVVSVSGGKNKRFKIELYPFGQGGGKLPSHTLIVEDEGYYSNGSVKGQRYRLIEPEFNNDIAAKFGNAVKLPPALYSQSFYQQLSEEIKDGTIGDFFVNAIITKLANGANVGTDTSFSESRASQFELVKTSDDGTVQYQFKDNAWKYRDPLNNTLEKVFSNSKRKKLQNAEGSTIATTIVASKSTNLSSLIEETVMALSTYDNETLADLSNVNKRSRFADGTLDLLDNGLAKIGIKNGLEGRSNRDLSKLDQMTFQLEYAYLDAAEANAFKSAVFQAGTMSDRSMVPEYTVGLHEEVIPIKNGKWDEETLTKNYEQSLVNSIRSVNETVTNEWKGYLNGLLTDGLVTFNQLGIKGLDEIRDISDLYKALDKAKLNFDEVRANSGLVMHMMITPHTSTDENGKKIKYANLNFGMVQYHEIMTGTSESAKWFRNLLIDTNKKMFFDYVNSLGYDISDRAVKIISNRIGNGSKMSSQEAKNILLSSYFYQDGMVEQELISFLGGTVFQYARKEASFFENMANDGVLEDMDSLATISKNPKAIIDYYSNLKVNGKSLSEITFDELEAMGSGGNRFGLIKAITESPMSVREKAVTLLFDDIASGMSPQYIDRVKRNQGIGTNFQNYILAENGEPGMFVPKESRVMLFDDPTMESVLLNSGEMTQDIYDAMTQISPIFAYQHNFSLGNRFSNFRGKGGALKTINSGNYANGIYNYEKKADFNMFSHEMIMNATPAHQRIFEMHHHSVKFDNQDPEYEGLFLDEDPVRPSLEFNTPITIDQLRKHGESLGEIMVNGAKTNAQSVLYRLKLGETTEDELQDIRTNKTLVRVNSALDLYRFWNGEELDAKLIRETDNQDEFVDEFPFGYTWFKVAEAMSNYRGSDNSFPLRNAYITRSFTGQTNKTGQKNVNPAEMLTQPVTKFSDIKVHTVSNKYSGPVLMLDLHKGDTTASMNVSSDEHDDLLSMITQIISSSVAEGYSIEQSEKLFKTVGNISQIQLDIVQNILDGYIAEEASNPAHNKNEKKIRAAAMKSFAKDLAEKTLATRKDPGATGELIQLADEDPSNLSFDIRQVLPLLRSAITADMSKRTVRIKVSGAQYALGSATEKIKTYTIPGYRPLIRNSTNGTNNDANGVLKEIITTNPESLPDGWQLEPVERLADLEILHNKFDYVYIKNQAIDQNGETKDSYTPIRVKDALKQMLASEDKVIFVHPVANDVDTDSEAVINFDTEYNDFDKWEEAKARAATEGKVLVTSNPAMLSSYSQDFDKVYTVPKLDYVNKEISNDKDAKVEELLKDKRDLDVLILRTVDQSKVVSTANPLSSILNLGGTLYSPWLKGAARNGTVDGDDLKYMDYIKDGQSIYKSPEYNSYFLAGKAPRDLKSIKADATNRAVKPVYTGVFVNPNDVTSQFEPAHPNVFGGHVTIAFRPDELGIDVGKAKQVRVIGRLVTDKVDALIVENVDSNNEVSHITLSVADGVKPFQSNAEIKNNADKIDYFKPVSFKGKYGYFSQDGKIITGKLEHRALVKQNYGQALVDEVGDYFEKETGDRVPPSVLLAKFFYRNDPNLKDTPVFGPNLLADAKAMWNSTPEQTQEFLDFLQENGKNPQRFTEMLKPQLMNTLEQDSWHTKESEFYMPPHHQAAYLIEYGDLIEDFQGTQEQPDLTSIAHLVTEDELDMIHTKWYENKDEVKAIIDEKLMPTEEGKKYVELREIQNTKTESAFTTKVQKLADFAETTKLTSTQYRGLKRRAPIFLLLKSKNNKVKSLKTIDELLADEEVITNPDAMKSLFDLRAVLSQTPAKDAESVITNAIENFKRKWVITMTDSFDKSLTFLTARIPAHGQPSATAGKIKQFIYSTRNTIYGPKEMLTIAGSDHDGDKQNNVTWDVDNLGRIIDWKPYLSEATGVIDMKNFKDELEDETATIRQTLIDSGVPSATATAQSERYKSSRLEMAYRAMQNMTTDLMVKIAKDPKNAIQATTATSMRKLGIIKDYLDSFNFSSMDLNKFNVTKEGGMSQELLNAILERQYALPFVPSTKFLYEKVNGDGKQGVGIFASAIKTYYATYFAWLTNGAVKNYGETIDRLVRNRQINLLQDDIEAMHNQVLASMSPQQAKEEKYIKFTNSRASEAPYKNLGVKEDAFHFVWKNPVTGLFEIKTDIFTLANSKQYMPTVGQVRSKLRSKAAQEVFSDMLIYQSTSNAEKEAESILKHMESLDAYNSMIMEDQAWEDLAELLNAATDNAKELILSKIGANRHTSSLISTMVMLGIDLKSALLVLNDPIIKDVQKTLEEGSSLTKGKQDIIFGFRTLLTNAAKNYSPSKVISDTDLEKLVRENVEEGTSEEDIKKEVQRQKDLRKVYNPGQQLQWYLDMANEITKLSSNLSINQGLPNSELDVLNYITGLESSFGLTGLNTINTEFTMNDFLEDTPEAREDILNKYDDKLKVAFNVPYIMTKNAHMFMYISSLYKTNDILGDVSYTVRLIYDDLVPLLPPLKNKLENQELKSYLDLVMGVSIDQFYKKNKRIFTFDNVSYDMAKYKDRVRFVKDFPDILKDSMAADDTLGSNVVLNKVGSVRTETDPVTGESYTYLSGIDTSVLESGQIQIFKNLLANLKISHPEIHDALFHYSLNVDKGAIGKNSIASLFEGEDYLVFSKFLSDLEKNGSIEERVKNIPAEVKQLLMPFLLEDYSTQKGVKNDSLRKMYSGEGDDLSADQMSEMIESEMTDGEDIFDMAFMDEGDADTGATEINNRRNALSDKYDVSNMNALKQNNYNTYPTVFRSKTNGLLYAWYEAQDTYIPINRIESPVLINSDITRSTDVVKNMKDLGYDWGFEITIPGKGEKGRLLNLEDEFEKTYNVLMPDGKTIAQFTEEQIIAVNPQLYLAKKAILVNKANYSVREELQFYRNPKTGNLYQIAKPNTEMVTAETTEDKIAHDYDTMTKVMVDTVNNIFKGKNVAPESYSDIMDMYDDLVTQLQMVALMTENKGKITAANIPGTIQNIKQENSSAVGQSVLILGKNLHSLTNTAKYKLLRGTKQARIDMLKAMSRTNGMYENTDVARDYGPDIDQRWPIDSFTRDYNGKQLVKGDQEILTNDRLLSEMTIRDFLDIATNNKMLNKEITPQSYLKMSGNHVLTYKDKVYVSPDIKVKSIEPKERKADLVIPANEKTKLIKEVSPEVIRRLGVFLNDRFENTRVLVLSKSDIKTMYGNKFAEASGFVYQGTIVLNSDIADLNTMVHEMGHLYLAELKDADPDEYDRVISLVTQDPIMEEIKRAYPELSDSDVAEEAFVELLARRNSDKLETELTRELEGDDGTFLGKVKSFFKNLFGSFFGVSENKLKDTDFRLSDSLYDVIDKIGTDMIFNKNSALNTMTTNEKSIIKNKIGENAPLSRSEAIKFLTEKGYIRKVC